MSEQPANLVRMAYYVQRSSEMTAIQFRVLMALCARADAITGECWPSAATIAADIGSPRNLRSVQQALAELSVRRRVVVASEEKWVAGLGFIEPVAGMGGGRSVTVTYRLLTPGKPCAIHSPLLHETLSDSLTVSDTNPERIAHETLSDSLTVSDTNPERIAHETLSDSLTVSDTNPERIAHETLSDSLTVSDTNPERIAHETLSDSLTVSDTNPERIAHETLSDSLVNPERITRNTLSESLRGTHHEPIMNPSAAAEPTTRAQPASPVAGAAAAAGCHSDTPPPPTPDATAGPTAGAECQQRGIDAQTAAWAVASYPPDAIRAALGSFDAKRAAEEIRNPAGLFRTLLAGGCTPPQPRKARNQVTASASRPPPMTDDQIAAIIAQDIAGKLAYSVGERQSPRMSRVSSSAPSATGAILQGAVSS